jgi:tRNA pseudouridine55 synthase
VSTDAPAVPAVMSGLVVVDKPAGWTSHDVVAKMRGLAGTKKVGHAGTLDPMATGVLLLGLNKATRLLGHLSLAGKTYVATARLGVSTLTDDAEGETTSVADASSLTDEQIRAAAARFEGSIEQIPSAVSAIKVDGKRAYARVRAGEDVQLAARPVTVSSLRVGDIVRTCVDDVGVVDVEVTVECSSGTYIRALARDIGGALGVGGHLTSLRRTAIGPFGIDDASTLTEIEAADEVPMLDITEVAGRLFPRLDLDEGGAADVRTGRRLVGLDLSRFEPGKPIAVFAPDGTFLALYERGSSVLRPVAVFV